MTSNTLLQFDGLSVSYGRRVVFSNAALALDAGVYALQGPNGIGKSTMLLVLAGVLPADAGTVWIDGVDLMRAPEKAKQRLSYVPDESPIYPFMTGKDLLLFVASIKRSNLNSAVLSLIKRFQLSPCLDARFDAMSLGTQKKILVCASLIGSPRVLLFDEPSNGLDLEARACLVEHVREWGRHGTVLLTSHDVDFVRGTGASVISMPRLIGAEKATREDDGIAFAP